MALKILLADDSMTAQNMGKKILVDAGYDVVAVSNGAAAIKKVAAERPDIAILDEYMPGYTGSEVCERIKAAAETAKIPVLLTVGKMEPFDPEKASKVHADGVMIKPFEASDLVAAVQSIAQRLLAPAPTTRSIDATVQLRSPGDTGRIARPPAEPDHEDTLRLTAEQIKAFQDASYHEWAKTAEPHLEEHEKAAAATAAVPEMAVAAPAEEEHTVAIPHETAEMLRAALAAETAEPTAHPGAPRETPVYDAMSAAGVAAEHEILNGTTTPVAPIYEPAAPVQEAAVEAPPTPVFYTPPVVAEPEPEPPATPAFAVEPVVPAEVPEAPVISVAAPEPVMQVPEAAVEPVAEAAPVVLTEPVIAVEPIAPVVETAPIVSAPVLETSAPKTPGPMPVAPAADLEPTSAPAVEIAAAPAHELEITSPPQERGALVTQDPALITEAEDMAQFTTKFGVESAEPVHVGLTADLSDEQLAAIISPPEEEDTLIAEVPAAVIPEPMVEPEVAAEPEPVLAQEIPSIQAVEPAVVTEPIVTHVPEPEPAIEAPAVQAVTPEIAEPEVEAAPAEPEVAPGPVVESVVAEPAIIAPEPAVEPVAEVAAASPVMEPAADVAHEREPEPLVAQEIVPEPAVTAVAEIAAEPEKPAQEEHVLHAVETALAAAATVAAPGIAHVIHAEPQHVEEPASEPTPVTAEPEPVRHSEPMGDAALAEELAAAISRKETEERAKAAAETAATAAMEQVAAEAAAPAADLGVRGLNDNRLAEAVARAFESLKPQLITEIIKELSK